MSDIYDMHSFTLNVHPGYNENGDPDGSTTAVSKTGFITAKQKLVVNEKGEDVLSSGNILIEYNNTITLEDTVTIGSNTRNIVAITHEKDFSTNKTTLWLR